MVEDAYGWSKGRWWCLLKRLDASVCDVLELNAVWCVLHNVCEIHGDSVNEDWMEGVEASNNISTADASSLDRSGENIRQVFIAYFQQHSI